MRQRPSLAALARLWMKAVPPRRPEVSLAEGPPNPLAFDADFPAEGLSLSEMAALIRLHVPANCLHATPRFASDPVRVTFAPGSFLAPESPDFLNQARTVIHGVWLVDWFPHERRLALHFIGQQYSLFAEIFKEDIAAVTTSNRGPDLTTEVITADGDYFVLAGRQRRMKAVLRELGLPA